MVKSKKIAPIGDGAVGVAAKGFVPDPSLREVDITQPRIDASAALPGGDKELWLLQMPHDFPSDHQVEWEINDDPLDGFRGRCQVQGVEYLLVPDQPALSSSLYATPAGQKGKLVPVVRRMTVVRSSVAPLVCFGQSAAEVQAAGMVAPGAPVVAAAKPAAASRQRLEARQAAAAAPAPPGQQQQQQQQQAAAEGSGKQKKDKSEKKRKKAEAEAAAVVASDGCASAVVTAAAGPAAGTPAAGGEGTAEKKAKKEKKEKKKDKSEKKAKKEKKGP